MREAVGRAQCLAQRERSEWKSGGLPGGGHCTVRSRNERLIRESRRETEACPRPARGLAVQVPHHGLFQQCAEVQTPVTPILQLKKLRLREQK